MRQFLLMSMMKKMNRQTQIQVRGFIFFFLSIDTAVKEIHSAVFTASSSVWNRCRGCERSMDGAGDGGSRWGVGSRRRAAQPEDLHPQQPHIRRDIGEDGLHWIPEDGGAVPQPDQKAEEDLQALLQQPEVNNVAEQWICKCWNFSTPSRHISQHAFDLCFPEAEGGPRCTDTSTSWLRCSVTIPRTLMWTLVLQRPPCNLSWAMILTCVGLNVLIWLHTVVVVVVVLLSSKSLRFKTQQYICCSSTQTSSPQPATSWLKWAERCPGQTRRLAPCWRSGGRTASSSAWGAAWRTATCLSTSLRRWMTKGS